jgi:hypothetical protein
LYRDDASKAKAKIAVWMDTIREDCFINALSIGQMIGPNHLVWKAPGPFARRYSFFLLASSIQNALIDIFCFIGCGSTECELKCDLSILSKMTDLLEYSPVTRIMWKGAIRNYRLSGQSCNSILVIKFRKRP